VTRLRKLLLHKHEIIKLKRAVQGKGYTVIPTRMYFVKGLAKMEIALARGKDLYDKRQTLKQRDAQREIEKAVKRY
jgi:SsrA-binding protein